MLTRFWTRPKTRTRAQVLVTGSPDLLYTNRKPYYLPPSDSTVYNGLRSGDLFEGLLVVILFGSVDILNVLQIRWGRNQMEERRRTRQAWSPENLDFPVFTSNVVLPNKRLCRLTVVIKE